MEQWRDASPLPIREPLEINIQGDWVLTATQSQSQGPKVVVINLVGERRERTDAALQAFLDSLGIRVVDVQLRGELERVRVIAPLDERAFANHAKFYSVNPRSVEEAVAAFLDLLGQVSRRHASVPVYPEGESEVTLAIKAGYSFQRKGVVHVIDFNVLSKPLLRLLADKEIKVLVIDPAWNPPQVFRAMSEHLGLPTEESYRLFISARDPRRNISIVLPGTHIEEEEKSYLVTPMALPASLSDYLSRKGVRPLSYAH
jgi:hypothetical protein